MKRESLLRHLRLHGCVLRREGKEHSLWENPSAGHAEAVRFSIEPAETGGLSGSTISEGISWKKFDPNVESAEVFLDANLSVAICASLLGARDAAGCFNFRHEDDGTLTAIYKGQSFNLSQKYGF